MNPTARALGLVGCAVCGQLNRRQPGAAGFCARCSSPLHERKPQSWSRCAALTSAAAILYLPANLYPVLETQSFSGVEAHTILQGVVELWLAGSWLLALLVCFASVVVPLLKLTALTLLLMTVRFESGWLPREQTRLYRVIEFVGRWSMLDIYVVALLVALVHLRSLAQVQAGAGAVAFGAVVVLTMLATRSFDPRLLWDGAQRRAHA